MLNKWLEIVLLQMVIGYKTLMLFKKALLTLAFLLYKVSCLES